MLHLRMASELASFAVALTEFSLVPSLQVMAAKSYHSTASEQTTIPFGVSAQGRCQAVQQERRSKGEVRQEVCFLPLTCAKRPDKLLRTCVKEFGKCVEVNYKIVGVPAQMQRLGAETASVLRETDALDAKHDRAHAQGLKHVRMTLLLP